MMLKQIITASFLMLTSLVASSAQAPPADPPLGPISGLLTTAELEKLRKGEIILHSGTREGAKSGGGYAVGLIAATPNQVWGTILNFDSWSEFMVRVDYCKVTRRTENRINVDFVIDAGFTDVRYSIIYTFEPEKNLLTWTLDQSKPADFISRTTGYWQLEPLKQGGTLVQYNVQVDIDIPIIGPLLRGIIRKLTLDDLPGVVAALKKRVESGNKWKK